MNIMYWNLDWIKGYIAICSVLHCVDFVYSTEGTLPSFTDTPLSVFTSKGSVAILQCGVENLGTKTVSWRKLPYNVPITVGKEQFLEIERFKLYQQPHQGEWNLHIKNAQTFDSGIYQCQVSTKQMKIRRNVTLTVLDTTTPPVTSGIYLTGTHIVEKGAPLHLHCNATSTDDNLQSLDWFKDGKMIQTSYADEIFITQKVTVSDHTISSSLDIEKARMSDMGLYICRASRELKTRLKVDVLNAETYNEKRDTQSEPVNGQSTNSADEYRHSEMCFLSALLFTIVLHFFRIFQWRTS